MKEMGVTLLTVSCITIACTCAVVSRRQEIILLFSNENGMVAREKRELIPTLLNSQADLAG